MVARNKRTTSSMEWFHNAYILRAMVVDLLIRDFGLRLKKKTFARMQEEFDVTEEDISLLKDICTKYGIAPPMFDKFPYWFIEAEREKIFDLNEKLMYSIRMADAITVRDDHNHILRQQYIAQAISYSFMLLDDFNFMNDNFPVKKRMFLPFIERVSYEIELLTDLKKRDRETYLRWRRRILAGDSKVSETQHTPTPGVGKCWADGSGITNPVNPFDEDISGIVRSGAEVLDNIDPLELQREEMNLQRLYTIPVETPQRPYRNEYNPNPGFENFNKENKSTDETEKPKSVKMVRKEDAGKEKESPVEINWDAGIVNKDTPTT